MLTLTVALALFVGVVALYGWYLRRQEGEGD